MKSRIADGQVLDRRFGSSIHNGSDGKILNSPEGGYPVLTDIHSLVNNRVQNKRKTC